MTWLEALKNLGTETILETQIDTDAASPSDTELSESLTQQGDKGAKRGDEGLLAPLSLPHIRNSESHALEQGRLEKNISRRGQPWLDTLRSVEGTFKVGEERAPRIPSPTVDVTPESLVQQGDKSAKSPTPSPNGEGIPGNTTDRVLLSLLDGPSYPADLQEKTNLAGGWQHHHQAQAQRAHRVDGSEGG